MIIRYVGLPGSGKTVRDHGYPLSIYLFNGRKGGGIDRLRWVHNACTIYAIRRRLLRNGNPSNQTNKKKKYGDKNAHELKNEKTVGMFDQKLTI